ncbi:MAG TPA: thioester reductase domain-containing protein [Candidatus Dormibacteraeota bacterium]|nr:thioester reductase domain-containing protein [Candidatus Dormibacteraeota bacterium]
MTDLANDPLSSTQLAALRSSLRAFARAQLPDAMVPARFVVLDRLPTLPNGKVDRRSLAGAGERDEPDQRGYVAPRTPVEGTIAGLWQDVLGVGRVGVETSFFELGGDSLSAVQMMSRVRAQFDVPIALRQLFERPTVAELARLISGAAPAEHREVSRSISSEELAAEAVLPDDVGPEPAAARATGPPYGEVLLTGGTGFTGAFLVRELLDRGGARVHLLVRAADAAEAVARVCANMARYGVARDGDERRLAGVAGDLGRPYLGLGRSTYRRLAAEVDLVIHNGSWSSFVLPYQSLKPINVLGTLEILRLAGRTRVKPVHYVSSLAVFPGHREVKHFDEVVLTDPDGVVGGYPQSKWVADRLTTLAGERGLPVAVHRPGQITGARDTGACPPDLFVCAMMKSCIQLGVGPDPDMLVEMVPVDFMAAAIVHLALTGRGLGRVHHLPNSAAAHWTEVIAMLGECGYPVRREHYTVWYRELAAAMERGDDNAMLPFMPLLGPEGPAEDLAYQNGSPFFASDNLAEGLRGSGIVCPPVSRELLQTYLDYFVSTGYLEPPR